MEQERRDRVVQPTSCANRSREERVIEAKPFDIPKREVWEAFKKVKANQGAAGVDGQTIEAFEADLASSLYKLWNRMSSGSYHPAPVRRVMIPKAGGGERPLGIPTVADRVAQEVVKQRLERVLEPIFHDDSYGYRPGRSAIDAVRQARQRCWRSNWVLDIDIKSFFDTIDWDMLLKAVRAHTDCPWTLLYIERWLKAPVQLEDGSIVAREAGTPQGGVISPLLANLFLHYAFDEWMAREFPHIPFERYADDIICHCKSEAKARALWAALDARFSACKLTLHPMKTKIAYCKDWNRRGDYPVISFDFLGYNFRPRKSIWRGKLPVHSFLPAISPKAANAIGQAIRGWRLHHWTQMSLEDLATKYNKYIQGWIGYFGHFYGGRLSHLLRRIDVYLIRWARRKYRRLLRRPRGARYWLAHVRRSQPTLFAHWRFVALDGRASGAV
jgi:RNA-directed DNA polymerase